MFNFILIFGVLMSFVGAVLSLDDAARLDKQSIVLFCLSVLQFILYIVLFVLGVRA